MKQIENDCYGCTIPCKKCGRDHSVHYYCDNCGDETELFYFENEELCIDCIKDKLEKVI